MTIPLVDLKANYLSIKGDIDAAIKDVILNSAFIMGPKLKMFEENFARMSGMEHCICVANGTVAVELALRALGIKKGDEVITAANTFIATSESITNVGAKVVLCDVEQDSLNLDPALLMKRITKKTKAIIAVHLYGRMAEMEEIKKIADSHNLLLIEDAAQAHLAEYKGKKPGVISGMATYSFFPAKNLGAFGDAGAIVTNNAELAKKMDMLRNHGRTDKYLHEFEGHNYRMDTLQAAILDAKLKYLDVWTRARIRHAKMYDELFAELNKKLGDVVTTPKTHPDYKQVYYMYVIRVQRRDELMKFLAGKGIQCGIHYPIPLHLQPAYRYLKYRKGDFPVAEKACDEILSIPMYPELSEEQVRYVVGSVEEFFGKK
ncbi:MAG: DegT/DnrJ/EryC1/StrS family aminotransferase [Nanoarchaeota archaeon]